MATHTTHGNYGQRLADEGKAWGDHLKVEAAGELYAWLDHPLIAEHYNQRAMIEGMPWEDWVKKELGGPVQKSLDLGCGSGGRSIELFQAGVSRCLHGYDVSAERIAEAERRRQELRAPGCFELADTNAIQLPPETYDLIFSCHSFHHFLDLEHIMEQIHSALTRNGLFILEEYVGPTQLQWTDRQMELVRSLLSLMPERLRRYRTDVLKNEEARPTPDEVAAVSPFESIRSAEILPLFTKYFQVVTVKRLGGTIQHLLYNGIVHNFDPQDQEAVLYIETTFRVEDALTDGDVLPSDFMLLVGRRKDAPMKPPVNSQELLGVLQAQIAEFGRQLKTLTMRLAENEETILGLRAEVVKKKEVARALSEELGAREAELDRMKSTLGWRLLSRFGPIKYRYLLPVYRLLGLEYTESQGKSESKGPERGSGQ